jgi:hypothetical protein
MYTSEQLQNNNEAKCVLFSCQCLRLCSVGDEFLNENELMVEWWQGKTEVLAENMSQSYSVHHKSHRGWPGIQPKNNNERYANA